MLTMFDDDDSVFAAMRAGARGYLLKGASQQEIIRAIHAVAAGEAIFGPGVARRVLQQLTGQAPPEDPFPDLTPRERQVLELLVAGLNSAAIGQRLGLATKTVANHISAVFTKLQSATGPTPLPARAVQASANANDWPGTGSSTLRRSGLRFGRRDRTPDRLGVAPAA